MQGKCRQNGRRKWEIAGGKRAKKSGLLARKYLYIQRQMEGGETAKKFICQREKTNGKKNLRGTISHP